MRVNVSQPRPSIPHPIYGEVPILSLFAQLTLTKDPEIQKATKKTNPVDVMHALREMKNNIPSKPAVQKI